MTQTRLICLLQLLTFVKWVERLLGEIFISTLHSMVKQNAAEISASPIFLEKIVWKLHQECEVSFTSYSKILPLKHIHHLLMGFRELPNFLQETDRT